MSQTTKESLCVDAFRNDCEHGDGPVEVLDCADWVVCDEADDNCCPGAPEVDGERGGQDDPHDSPTRRQVRAEVDGEPKRREVVSVVTADEVGEIGLAYKVRLIRPEEEHQSGETAHETAPNQTTLDLRKNKSDSPRNSGNIRKCTESPKTTAAEVM
jgi:hypothetical protein